MKDINVEVTRNKNEIIIYIGKKRVSRVIRKRLDSINIRAQLKQIMTARDISQSDLARRIGKSRQWIHQLVNGDRGITINTIRQLEKALSVKFERSA